MKRIQIFAAILLLAGTAKAQSAIDEARKQIVNENYNAARKVLTEYIGTEKDPAKQAQAYFWMGETYYQDLIAENPIKAMESAREQYNKGLAIDKGNAYCQVGMGKLLLDAKNIKEAQKTFDSAVRNSKEKPYREFGSPQIQMLIGDSWLNGLNKNAEQAVNYYTRARDIDPSKAVYLIRMGDGNLAKGDAGAAMTAYESASSKDPRNPEVYLKRAVIWHRAGKIDLAIKECEDGKKADPTYAPIYKMLAELHYANKDYNKVTGDLDEYLKVVGDPTKDPDAWLRFIKFLTYQAKDYTRAIDESKKFSAKFSNQYPSVYRWLAWSSFEKGMLIETKAKEAKATTFGDDWKMLMTESNNASKTLMQLLPADRLVDYDYTYAAKSAMRIGKMDDAMPMFKKVMEMDSSKTCGIYSDLMQNYADQKLYKEWLDMLDKKTAAACKPSQIEYFYAMYYAFYFTKEYDRTNKYADKYIEISPAGSDGYFYKGKSLSQVDTTEPAKWLAKENYEKWIGLYELKPDDRAKSQINTAYIYMALYYGSQNDIPKAKEFLQKVLAIDPANTQALDLMKQMGG